MAGVLAVGALEHWPIGGWRVCLLPAGVLAIIVLAPSMLAAGVLAYWRLACWHVGWLACWRPDSLAF